MSGRYNNHDQENGSPGHDRLVLWIQKHAPQWLKQHIAAPPDCYSASRSGMLDRAAKELTEKRERRRRAEERIAGAEKRSTGPDADYWQREVERETKELKALSAHIRALEDLALLPREPPLVLPKYHFQLEHVIAGGRGYIDVLATVTYPHYGWTWAQQYGAPRNGEMDLPQMLSGKTVRMAAFEAKLSIPSLGALLRQLRFYQSKFSTYSDDHTYRNVLPYVVVSPDTHYRPQIEEQGFQFWESPPLEP